MKKLLLLIFLSISTFPCLGQIYTCVNIDGYWGNWQNSGSFYTKGKTDNFIIYAQNSHPSQYTFKVVITNYSWPDNKTKRQHRKNDEWYEYSGYIEWTMPEEDEIKDAINVFPVCPYSPSKKYKRIRRKATIKIEPYKKFPNVYNIWFDGYGIGIQKY